MPPAHRAILAYNSTMDTTLAIALGICLAASCGFRVFAPLLITSIAANADFLHVSESFSWLGSWPAVIAFAVATVLEIGAFYVPWLDHVLDVIATPIAAIAGAVLFAAVAFDLDPFVKWALAIIAGGGSAAVVQGGTMLTRAGSTATTGGFANFVVSTFETIAAIAFPVLSLILPLLTFVALIALILVMYFAGRGLLRRLISVSATSMP
jgi:Domain of unknown function (DUF4126)